MSSFTKMHNDYLDPDRFLNEPQFPESCGWIVNLIRQYGNPYAFYRAIYKSTYGPSIGVEIDGEWIYSDDLPDTLDTDRHAYTGLSVSSIIEGADFDVDGERMGCGGTQEDFWNLVERVGNEVEFYWKQVNCVYFKITHPGTSFDQVIEDYYQWIDWNDRPESIDADDPDLPLLKAAYEVLTDEYSTPDVPHDIPGFDGYKATRIEPEIDLY